MSHGSLAGVFALCLMTSVPAAALDGLPLLFIENRGQSDPRVAFYIQSSEKSVYFTREGVTFYLHGAGKERFDAEGPRPAAYRVEEKPAAPRWAVKLDFVGANPALRLRGQDPMPGIVSYFKGSADRWHVDLPTYASLVYEEVWPGIDLEYAASGDRLKYTFVVQPAADPAQIQLAYRGGEVRVNGAGELEVETP